MNVDRKGVPLLFINFNQDYRQGYIDQNLGIKYLMKVIVALALGQRLGIKFTIATGTWGNATPRVSRH